MISWWDIWLQLTLISYRRLTFNPFYFSFSPPSLFSGISQPFIYFSVVFLCLHHSHCEQKASLSVFSFTCMSCSFPSSTLFFLLLVLAQWCLSSFFHSFLFDVSFCVCIIYPLFYPFHSFSSLHLYSWASLHYQGVFTSTLLSLSLCASRSFLPCSPPYFFFHCPLIFMRLTGQPHSASLSLSVGEEAAQCQQLMDFWRTQTAMHHSPENYIGRKRRRIWSEANGRVIWDREGNRRMRERVIAKKKIKVRGSSQAIHGKEIGEKNILLVGAIINKNSLQI